MNMLVTPECKPTATTFMNPYVKNANNYAGVAVDHGTAKDMSQEFDSEELDAELVEMKLPAYDDPDAAQMDAAQTLGDMANTNYSTSDDAAVMGN